MKLCATCEQEPHAIHMHAWVKAYYTLTPPLGLRLVSIEKPDVKYAFKPRCIEAIMKFMQMRHDFVNSVRGHKPLARSEAGLIYV